MTCAAHGRPKMRRPPADSSCMHGRAQNGLVLLALLLTLALGALASLIAAELWATTMHREREAQLLFVGDQYRRAIASYYQMSPTPVKVLPTELGDLVEDPRFPMRIQHLRRLYPDPIKEGSDWGLVKQGAGIVGVYSTSEMPTLKRGGFPALYKDFERAATYDQWRFVFKAQQSTPPRPTRPSP
jgi:type II secretory pathway pseudopilin PulG